MKKNILLLFLFELSSCDIPFPSFRPEVTVFKSIEFKKVLFEWHKARGIMDQNYPDYISATNNKHLDTICKSTNIAELKKVGKDSILIGFYGIPKWEDDVIEIPVKYMYFNIIVDTLFKK